jgi:hypothetical protein
VQGMAMPLKQTVIFLFVMGKWAKAIKKMDSITNQLILIHKHKVFKN